LATNATNNEALQRPSGARRFYNPALDGLRFFAFLGVFTLHALSRTVPISPAGSQWSAWETAGRDVGMLGVDLFFVLSSYLITKLLLIEKDRTGTVDIRSFYVRRILRIWPLYFGFLIFMLVSQLVGTSHPNGLEWFGYACFFANWVAVYEGRFLSTRGNMFWTLSIEEQFYLTWPWIVSKVNRVTLIRICWGMVAFATILRAILGMHSITGAGLACNTLARLDPLALGAILAASPRIEAWFASLRWPLLYPPVLLIMAATMQRLNGVSSIPLPVRSGGYLLIAALLCAFAVGCMLRPDSSRLKIFAWRPIVYLGRISYGLYVFHGVLVGTGSRLAQRIQFPGSGIVVVLLEFVGTVLVASCSFKFFERPFLSLKERFARVPSRPGG
jgi:peptidoglycan/LPS O-acetylase OafA/YrhL